MELQSNTCILHLFMTDTLFENIAWMPHYLLDAAQTRGCFGLTSSGFICFVFPTLSSVIDWIALRAAFSVKQLTFRVPLVGSPDDKEVNIHVRSEAGLRTFLRVLLIQFSRFGGMHVDRLGPTFRKALGNHPKPVVFCGSNLRLREDEKRVP
jgi:hypothetical protein